MLGIRRYPETGYLPVFGMISRKAIVCQKKQNKYKEVIDLCCKANKQGWAGDWDANGFWKAIISWIGIKALSTWSGKNTRTAYNRFLFGNVLTLLSAVIIAFFCIN